MRTADLVALLNHADTSITVSCERALLATLDGSCRTPIGAFTELSGISCTLMAEILSPDGGEFYRGTVSGARQDAVSIGHQLGARLLAEAGAEFQRQFKG